MKDNGVMNINNNITITVYPAEGGFGIVITEPKFVPFTEETGIALTIAHGMVNMALTDPGTVFDEGVNALAKLDNEEAVDKKVDMTEVIKEKKSKLN